MRPLTQVMVAGLMSSTTCVGGCTAWSALGVTRCSRSLQGKQSCMGSRQQVQQLSDGRLLEGS